MAASPGLALQLKDMIGFLKGSVAFLESDHAIVDVNGVGYEVAMPANLLGRLTVGQEASIWIHTHVREEQLDLFGFLDLPSKQLFQAMISISGLGPRTSLGILSQVDVMAFVAAVRQERVESLGKIKGVSEALASRINKELPKKIKLIQFHQQAESNVSSNSLLKTALLGLGYQSREIDLLLQQSIFEGSIQEQIKGALAVLSDARVSERPGIRGEA